MKELKSLDQDLQMKNTLSVDIRYADDTTLISTVFNKLKNSSGELEEACRKWGMKINGGKCRIISTSTDSIKIDSKNVDHVEESVFLGSVVPDTSADVMRRIALAASAFGTLRKLYGTDVIFLIILKSVFTMLLYCLLPHMLQRHGL